MVKETSKTVNLNNNLKRLAEIAKWFENQEEVDIENGLKKVKEAVRWIKTSKSRSKEIENEVEEIKREVESDTENN